MLQRLKGKVPFPLLYPHTWILSAAEGFGVWRWLLRIIGVAVGGYALLVAASAAMFRMDTAGELEWILQVDAVVGLALASAVVLVRVPAAGAGVGTARWHGLTALAAVAVWVAVSGGLVWSHLEQHRIRSTPPVQHGD